jgi:hypothetical protein
MGMSNKLMGCCCAGNVTVTLTILKACASAASTSVSIFSGGTLVASGTTSSVSRITVTGLIAGNAYTITSPSVSGPRWATSAFFTVPSGSTGTVSITTTFLPGTGYVQGGPTGGCTACQFPFSDNMSIGGVPGGPIAASYQGFTSVAAPSGTQGWYGTGPGDAHWGNAGLRTDYYLFYDPVHALWTLLVISVNTTTGGETQVASFTATMNCSTATVTFTDGTLHYTGTEAPP